MNVRIDTMPTYHVAYIRNIGPYGGQGGIPQLWPRLAHWAAARGLWSADSICLGIAHDDPRVTEAGQCRYDAAIVIPEGLQVDPDMGVTDIAGGTYAVTDFVGTPDEAPAAWQRFFEDWLPQSGFELDDRIPFDKGRGGPSDFPETGLVRCELCIPVRPRE
jgi:AraC family transcriptional regulator